MKRSELIFSFLLIPVDYLMLLAASLAAYFLRYNTFLRDVRPVIFEIEIFEYISIVAVVALIWLPIFALAQMYSIRTNRRLIHEFNRVVLGCSTGLVVIVLFIFFRHELFGSRFIVLAGYITAIIFVFLGRVIIRTIQRSLYEKRIGVQRTVVFGDDKTAYNIINSLKNDIRSGYYIVRQFRKLDDASLGSLANMAKHGSADMVINADPNRGRQEIARLYSF